MYTTTLNYVSTLQAGYLIIDYSKKLTESNTPINAETGRKIINMEELSRFVSSVRPKDKIIMDDNLSQIWKESLFSRGKR